MCGRATLTRGDLEEVARELGAEISPGSASEQVGTFRPRYNIAPSNWHWILEQAGDQHAGDQHVLSPAVWGYLANTRLLVNVRGEHVGSGRGFREAFQSRRCLMVTDGFLEWDKERAPFWYHRPDGGLVLLAGLYQKKDSTTSAGPPRFTVITTRPNQLVAQVHNRMPVVIAAERVDDWLNGPPVRANALIAPAPDRALIATAVSRRVNTVKNDDPDCLAPGRPDAAPRPVPRQGTLF